MKKVFILVLGLLLAIGPTLTNAQSLAKTGDPRSDQTLHASLSTIDEPKLAKEHEENYQDPTNYPLIEKGEMVDTLFDSYEGYHAFYFEEVLPSTYSAENMTVKLNYLSEFPYEKDRYITIEFFRDNGNGLDFLGTSDFDLYGFSNGSLLTDIPITEFEGQEFIYMRIGISQSRYDDYYQDTTTFKVTNPFLNEGEPTPSDTYVVISNESTNEKVSQSTGSFNVQEIPYTLDEVLEQGSYRMDANFQIDPASEELSIVQKHSKSMAAAYKVGDTKPFWVVDTRNSKPYQISARLAYSGSKADVWVHANQITDADATALGKEFEDHIYETITTHFGKESDVDQNGKINILTFDIQDGFSGSGGFIAGYFSSRDLFPMSYSNQSEIFYIDTYPTMGLGSTKNVSNAFGTLAHEFQHMVNYNQNVLVEGNTYMPTWLNEGLSEAADQMYQGSGLYDRLNYYNLSNSIRNGHSLLNWSGDVLSNYSLSYLFLQYVKIQAGQGDRIFKEIITDQANDYQAIENVAKKYISPDMTFGKLMTSFRLALFLKEPTGLYGFKGDPFFDALEERLYLGGPTSLLGGGAIVTPISAGDNYQVPADKGADVTYTLLGMDEVDTTAPASPVVFPVGDSDTLVKGTAEKDAKVTVKIGANTWIGHAGGTGEFSISIPKQKAGTVIEVTAEDNAGNVSPATKVTVVDKTSPAAPKVNSVSDLDEVLTGNTEANATVVAKVSGKEIGRVTADRNGSFKMTIKKQVAGTVIEVVAVDKAGNSSSATTIKVTDQRPTLEKLVGENRYETAVKVSNAGWDKANTVLLVNGAAIADGLTATPLASAEGAPILLTRKDKLPDETLKEIKRLNAKKIILIGGKDVITSKVANALTSQGLIVSRIGGENRFETSLLIARQLDKLVDVHTTYMAYGLGEPDALSIAAQSGQTKQPIILTRKENVPTETYNWLKTEALKTSYFIGGTSVIAPDIIKEMNKITSQEVSRNRLSGEKRQITNAKVIEAFYKDSDMQSIMVAHSNSKKLVDALAAGPLAAKLKVPVLLVSTKIEDSQIKVISKFQTKQVHQIGGGIEDKIVNDIVDLMN
ncbi:cell wall-binding repeat-containing protein [Bacillus sp. JJ1533]|uniref:cell wall-binding repeat-containing protein n=1 Tax=Bacillus sp. JJ1533 TaxID=3122959 RepID=UPI002FFEA325